MLKYTSNLFWTRSIIHNVRYKNPPHHWSVLRKKEESTQKALNHFDDFYKQVYGKDWIKIRNALLGEKKYVAVINNFGDFESEISNFEKLGALNVHKLFELRKQRYVDKDNIYQEATLKNNQENVNSIDSTNLELTNSADLDDLKSEVDLDKRNELTKIDQFNSNRLVDLSNALSAEILQEFIPATKVKGKEDFIPESTHYQFYDATTQLDVKIEKEYDFSFPEFLKIYCFEKENYSKFDPPKKGMTGVYNYYLMDGGSILPILALNVKPGNRILDMCASPGGKSLLAIQTLYPISIVSNDVSQSRLNKVHNAYKQFLFDFNDNWMKSGKIKLTNLDGRFISEGSFDRILVDAPCSTDRHSVIENDNNIFKSSRIKERLQLPVLQKELLVNALKLVKVGGIVVYSTCSLSPIENDGVVHMALKELWEESNMEFVVKDMRLALRQTRPVYNFYNAPMRYGHLVLPILSQNYGPTYFCKIQKIN